MQGNTYLRYDHTAAKTQVAHLQVIAHVVLLLMLDAPFSATVDTEIFAALLKRL